MKAGNTTIVQEYVETLVDVANRETYQQNGHTLYEVNTHTDGQHTGVARWNIHISTSFPYAKSCITASICTYIIINYVNIIWKKMELKLWNIMNATSVLNNGPPFVSCPSLPSSYLSIYIRHNIKIQYYSRQRKFALVHAMKAYGMGRNIVPSILNLGTRLRTEFNFVLRPFY